MDLGVTSRLGSSVGMDKADNPMKAVKLKKAVNEFEALFVNNMLKTMRSTITKSGLLDNGMREDIYTSLFDWEISKEMAAGGGLGLGRMLYKEFSRHEGISKEAQHLRVRSR